MLLSFDRKYNQTVKGDWVNESMSLSISYALACIIIFRTSIDCSTTISIKLVA